MRDSPFTGNDATQIVKISRTYLEGIAYSHVAIADPPQRRVWCGFLQQLAAAAERAGFTAKTATIIITGDVAGPAIDLQAKQLANLRGRYKQWKYCRLRRSPVCRQQKLTAQTVVGPAGCWMKRS